MPEQKGTVDIGKRLTALLMTFVVAMVILCLAGIVGTVYSYANNGASMVDDIRSRVFGDGDRLAGSDIVPFAQIPGFTYYKNPDHFEMNYEGGPDGKLAAWNAMYPYRVVFFSGIKTNTGYSPQGYDSRVYVLYSAEPVVNNLTFQYLPTRSTTGHIRATASQSSLDNFGSTSGNKWVLMYHDWQGISEYPTTLYTRDFAAWTDASAPYTFDFDFAYVDCGTNSYGNVNGLASISGVPYGYLYHCTNNPGGGYGEGGTGGGSSSGDDGSSSGDDGSSSGGGGSSSGDDGSSSGGGGSSSGDDGSSSGGGGSSGGDDSERETWPYGDDEPGDYDRPGGGTGDETLGEGGENGWTEDGDEKGDTWTLPGFSDDDGVEGEVGGYQEMGPGVDDWGLIEMPPGDSEWGLQEMPPGTGWGLIDFGALAG